MKFMELLSWVRTENFEPKTETLYYCSKKHLILLQATAKNSDYGLEIVVSSKT